jgi:cephalosporin hydroxylase
MKNTAALALKSITIDMEGDQVIADIGQHRAAYPLGTREAFSLISRVWLRSGWDAKYVYSFTWLGRPIIQLPEDMFRMQEVLFSVKPNVIIETGVAHGGGLIFYASLCKAMGNGRVIGVDVEIRPHNRQAIQAHELSPYITLIEGDSVAPTTLDRVTALLSSEQRVLVILDSNHSKDHVLKELQAYAPLVTLGSYIVAADGIMQDLVGAPRSSADWSWDNPRQAVLEFVQSHPQFVIEEPRFPFNEGAVTQRVTYWPDAFLKRVN